MLGSRARIASAFITGLIVGAIVPTVGNTILDKTGLRHQRRVDYETRFVGYSGDFTAKTPINDLWLEIHTGPNEDLKGIYRDLNHDGLVDEIMMLSPENTEVWHWFRDTDGDGFLETGFSFPENLTFSKEQAPQFMSTKIKREEIDSY